MVTLKSSDYRPGTELSVILYDAVQLANRHRRVKVTFNNTTRIVRAGSTVEKEQLLFLDDIAAANAKKKVVKLFRSGKFQTWNLVEGDQKCGPLGKHDYDFTCEVWVRERKLDKMGFVCDTNALTRLIEQRFQPESPREYPSCEQMAVELNAAIKRELVPNALRIRVRVYPLKDRYVESDRRY